MTAAAGAETIVAARGSPDGFAECPVANEAYEQTPTPPLKLFAFGAYAMIGVIVLTGLGVWQLERRVWKLDLINRVQQRVYAAPVPAPGPSSWPRISAADDAYRHIQVAGHFLDSRETLVRAVTERGGGYWVLAPFRTANGFTVLVNRGFIPADQAQWNLRATQAQHETVLTGLLRQTEPDGAFLQQNDPAADRWYSRDVAAITAARGIEKAAPYFIDVDSSADPAASPVGGLTVIAFPNNHLVYALTWFALAVMLTGWSLYVTQQEWRIRRIPGRTTTVNADRVP
jgi:surfeit locus 1 family protein